MSIRKQSPYGPFVERVVFPSIRIGALFLAVLAIGFGSWFGTNDSIESCSFASSMAMQQIFLYRNISSNITTPDSVSIGLWKHCYMYALNCSCTPASLTYQPGKVENQLSYKMISSLLTIVNRCVGHPSNSDRT